MTRSEQTTEDQGFKIGELIVHPSHGVGQIVSIDEQEIAGAKLELLVINFPKYKMIMRIPTGKIVSVGMRKLTGQRRGSCPMRDTSRCVGQTGPTSRGTVDGPAIRNRFFEWAFTPPYTSIP